MSADGGDRCAVQSTLARVLGCCRQGWADRGCLIGSYLGMCFDQKSSIVKVNTVLYCRFKRYAAFRILQARRWTI